MIPGRDADWGPRPSQGPLEAPAKSQAPSRIAPAAPVPDPERRMPRWVTWVAFALIGAIIAAIAAPMIFFRKSGTPEGLKSKETQRKRFNENEYRSRGRYETDGTSVKFNLPEKRTPTTEDEPTDPLAPGY